MPYKINNYKDLEALVKTTCNEDRTEMSMVGRLQYDFMYSMPQKIVAAKEGLLRDMRQGQPEKAGTLRLLEEAERTMMQCYEAYAENAPHFFTLARGESMLAQVGNDIAVTPAARNEIDALSWQATETHVRAGIRTIAAYSIVSTIIDGKEPSDDYILDLLNNYNINASFLREYQDAIPEAIDDMSVNMVKHQRDQLCDTMSINLRELAPQYNHNGNQLADGSWINALKHENEPIKLAPQKAVLHLDKLEMNTGKLNLDNYAEFLGTNRAVANRWAEQCFDAMFGGIYNRTELEEMADAGVNPLSGVFVDSKPIAEFLAQQRGGNFYPHSANDCRLAAQAILDGGHTLTVCRMEKNQDGVYDFGTPLKCEIRTELDENISLWRRILRFFGLEKTKEQRVATLTASDLEAEEAISAINDKRYEDRLARAVAFNETNILAVDEHFFADNAPVAAKKLNTYFDDLSCFDRERSDGNGVEQFHAVRTLHRPQTRATLAALYMLSEGMTAEEIYSSEPQMNAEKTRLGKQFIELITFPDREEYAKQNGIAVDDPKFAADYKAFCDQKEHAIMSMYTDKLAPALHALEKDIKDIDLNDPLSLAAYYSKAALCTQGGVDYLQSAEDLQKAHPENTKLNKECDYALAVTAYKSVVNYIESRTAALSPDGITNPQNAYCALAAKATAAKLLDSLGGNTVDNAPLSTRQIKNLAGMSTSMTYSIKSRMMEFERDEIRNMHGQFLKHLKSDTIPPAFSGMVENGINNVLDDKGSIKFPVTNKEFADQFTAAHTAKTAAPSLSRQAGK